MSFDVVAVVVVVVVVAVAQEGSRHGTDTETEGPRAIDNGAARAFPW